MIKKYFELNNIKSNFLLFYGENEGQKEEVITKNFISKFKKNDIFHYEESEILSNKDNLINQIYNVSLFNDKKLIIILRTTEKLFSLIEELKEKPFENIVLILNASKLETKSKLRKLFEKDKELIITPFYNDDPKTINNTVQNFFRSKNIPISNEIINMITSKVAGDRNNLKSELIKLESFLFNKKKVSKDEILKLTNNYENNNISDLVDYCLLKNKKKVLSLINGFSFNDGDSILIIRTFLNKLKRLLNLTKTYELNNNLELTISSFKPPIFWKDKDKVKNQIKIWPNKKIYGLINEINETELLIKKNMNNSRLILNNFIFKTSNN